MAEKKKITVFEVLVYVAYAFFILLGFTWFLVSLMGSKFFNLQAFVIVLIFGVQAYYRHRLTNLILGLVSLACSIYMLLDVINIFNLMARGATYDGFIKVMMLLPLAGIILSGILIFSYTKLSFKDQEG